MEEIEEIVVDVECRSDKTGDWVGCGIYVEPIDGNIEISDINSIYEGLEESFWELCGEFHEGLAQADALQEKDASLTRQQALYTVFGHFTLSFQVDGKPIDLNVDIDIDEFMYSLLRNVCYE